MLPAPKQKTPQNKLITITSSLVGFGGSEVGEDDFAETVLELI